MKEERAVVTTRKRRGDVKRSLARSKKSAVTVACELAKEGCSAVVPGGGLIFEGVKALVEHGVRFYEDRKVTRIEAFNRAICEGAEVHAEEIEFDLEDYVHLLSNAVQDEEDEKVDIYSRIFKALVNKAISPKFKKHFLKSSRNLLFSDFEFMRELYIASTYNFKDEAGIDVQIKARTRSNDVIKNLAIQNLIGLGYLYDKDGNKPPYPTELLKILVRTIYAKEELQPESIGKAIWKDVWLLGCFDLDKHSTVLGQISGALNKLNIQTAIAVPLDRPPSLGSFGTMFLFADEQTEARVEEFKKNHPQYAHKIVMVYLPGAVGKIAIQAGERYFIIEEGHGIDGFVEYATAGQATV